MTIVIPSETSLHFWSMKNGIPQLGKPSDMIRNFKIFEKSNVIKDGMQLYFVLDEITELDPFPQWFYKKILNLKYKSIHLGGKGQDFLLQMENFKEKLNYFKVLLARLGIENIIIHAQHLRKRREYLRDMFLKYLPNINILIENEGMTDKWGSSIEGLTELFVDCPEFKFCLDICHIHEIDEYNLSDLIDIEIIRSRIKEISISYCSKKLGYDPYAKAGYPGYGPNHALFSVLKEKISKKTKEFISQYPIVMEGVILREDKELNFIKEEIRILS